jgi:hypothetical protein
MPLFTFYYLVFNMAFISYYFKSNDGIVRGCGDEEDKEFFLGMGAKLTPSEFTTKPIPSGDSGSGEPFSNEWHINKILEMDTKEDVVRYTDSINCPDYDKRGGLDIVKEKAMQVLSND